MAPRAPFRCHVRSKLCDLRIGSSVVNYVSSSLVDNLNLQVTPHPTPYTAGGIVGAFSASISSQCRVPITIGEYQEDVLCDVMEDMNSDILLGRPWLYDNDVTFHARDNKYVFEHNGVSITVAPELTNEPDDGSVAVSTLIFKT